MTLRVLVGSVTKQVPEVLVAHLQSVDWQNLSLPGLPKVELTKVYIADPEIDTKSLGILERFGVHIMQADPKPQGARYAVNNVTHQWDFPTFQWLGQQKERLLDFARKERYDAIWLIDSDLLAGPETLASLLACEKDVVSAVFWTRWTPDQPPLPQVWTQHPYGFNGRGLAEHEFLARLAQRKLVAVNGLGACTLIRAGVLDRCHYFPPVDGLPSEGMWQGEDRSFSIRAARNHVGLFADAWPDIWHCYRPQDIPNLQAALERLNVPTKAPAVGDLVSFTVEPLEEAAFAGQKLHVRGRLGRLDLLPDLEAAVLDMSVGDERLIRVRFPLHFEVQAYRGQEKLVRVRLYGVKEYAPHPSEEWKV